MGVDVVGFAVGCPAGVADAQRPLHIGAVVNHIREYLETALGFAHLQALRLRAHRNAGGVIAPVFHPGQSVQQNRGRFLAAHITDNSTHR